MPDPRLLLLASHLRVRAEEILTKAETMDDAGTQWTMRDIADRYEKLAQQVEHRAEET